MLDTDRILALVLVACALSACSSSDRPEGEADAAADTGVDAARPDLDAGWPVVDAGPSGRDAGVLVDGGVRPPGDAATAPPADAGRDAARPDAGPCPVGCDDGNPCTIDSCAASGCAHELSASGTPCSTGVCDGAGACVACVSDGECAGATPLCAPDHRCTVGALGVDSGTYHSCARLSDGRVSCWGSNAVGQLGQGAAGVPARSLVPVLVPGLDDVTDLSIGTSATCVVRSSGEVWCWGFGALGGEATTRSTPGPVPGIADAVQVDVGWGFACARTSSGAVLCWGGNESGQLGDGTTMARTAPVLVSGLADATDLSTGHAHACAVRRSGRVVCWGSARFGRLGTGSGSDRLVPTDTPLTDAVEVAASGYNTCARRVGGAVSCWGWNLHGEVGDGTTTQRNLPVLVPDATAAIGIHTGDSHSCAIVSGGDVRCWGEIGRRVIGTTARPIAGFHGVTGTGGASQTVCAVVEAGHVWCMGDNTDGEIGDGTMTDRNSPTAVSGL